MKFITFALPSFITICLTVTSALPASAQDVKVAPAAMNLAAADFAPGSLKLPLTVHERSGVARKSAVVTSGVPFPIGFCKNTGKLGVTDADGKPVPSQAVTMIKWHAPTWDNSVQWALVSFVCDVPANGTATYYLVDNGPAAPATALKVSQDGSDILVDTGVASFTIPNTGDAFVSKAGIGDKPVIAGKGLRCTITSGDWPDRGIKAGDLMIASNEEAVVEESGPVRAVVRLRGSYGPGDSENKFYRFTARLQFETGSPALRIVHTIDNGTVDPELKKDGWRHVFTWPIEDASLTADLALGRSAVATTLAEDRIVTSDKGITIYQDSSGGEKWQNLPGGNYEQWLSRYTGGKTVRGVTFRGYRVTSDGQELAAGDASPGVVDVTAGGAGMTAALRNFRVAYPGALSADGTKLRVGLFPGEFSEPFCLNPGQRKTWDVRLTLHGADAPDLASCHAVQDTLLLSRADPAWMVRASIDGAWPYGLAMAPAPSRAPATRMDKSKLDGMNAGWDWFGWISGYNSGGGHWNEEPTVARWVLWGDGAEFDQAEARAQWADLTSIHFDNPDLPALWLWLRDWNDHEPRIKRESYPGWYNRDTWGRPDSGHMGMLMWPELYFLTGDMRYREDVEHLGNRARAFLWEHNYDDRSDGTGPMRSAVNWCKKRDPDADRDFKLATRYVGWPLFDLANWFRFCGDPQILAECRTVARAFRNTARFSPAGFMVTQINKAGSKEVYGGQGPFENYRDLSASQCYAHFQEGLMVTGLIEYYLMSRDIEALDAMTGFADLMTHHCMLRDETGKMRGWTYAFGDYWGPYTWDEANKSATFTTSNFTVTEGLGWIYRFTGRADFLEVNQAAVAAAGPASFNVAAALAAVAHPKVDQAPPAAVADLAAEAIGDGKVRLTWTAPGDNGREGAAASYQVKYHTGKLVELVKGWPDRTPPLPQDAREWTDKAAAFNAARRAFWSCLNVDGEPVPMPAGTKQSMIVSGLPPGNVNIALKTWDHADNVSDLSNVAEVAVK